MNRRSILAVLGAPALAAAVLLGACGGDDDGDEAINQDGGAPITSGGGAGSTVPNTFLEFDGERYRLTNILQADLQDEDDFEAVGEATSMDVDNNEPTVYRRDGSDAVFTFAPASGEGEEALGASWYEWSLDDGSLGGPAE